MASGMGTIKVSLDEKADEFLELLRSIHNRLDEHERQYKELWRRIHSLNETIEERGQRQARP